MIPEHLQNANSTPKDVWNNEGVALGCPALHLRCGEKSNVQPSALDGFHTMVRNSLAASDVGLIFLNRERRKERPRNFKKTIS